jgi:hypothetical protein
MMIGCGINDLYSLGYSASTIWAAATNVFDYVKSADTRWKLWISTVQPIATNASTAYGAAFTYNPAYEVQRQELNGLILTNSTTYFTGILRRDAWVNQRILATNGPASNDGVHFHITTYAALIWQFMAASFKGDGDYGLQPVEDFDGNIGNFQNINYLGSNAYIQGTVTAQNVDATNGFSSYAQHIPVAVSVGASPFSYTNVSTVAQECYFSDSAAYAVSKNGVGVYSSLAGDDYFIIMPTNVCTITYLSTTPTFYTNSL